MSHPASRDTLFAAYGTAYVDAQYRRHVVLVSSDGTTPTVVAGPHPCRAYIDVRCAWPNGIPTPDEDFAVNAGVAVWRDGTGVWRSVDGGPVHPVNAPADVAHLTLNSAGDLLIRPYTGEFGEGVTGASRA